MDSRFCCDGKCTRDGTTCPAFAPGVIDGPHKPKTGLWRAILRWLASIFYVKETL